MLDIPVSPELLPPDADGNIAQATEDLVGPYELHDFFLYHWLRNGFGANKVEALARHAFADAYDRATIRGWFVVFLERFHRQQFKRTTLPAGPEGRFGERVAPRRPAHARRGRPVVGPRRASTRSEGGRRAGRPVPRSVDRLPGTRIPCRLPTGN